MRLSKRFLVIALFGKSCTGKSTVADELGRLLGVQVRHCGEILKSHALQLGKRVSEISPEVHMMVDAETRAWAASQSELRVIEGIFLDDVLRGLNGTLFIRLVCESEVREERLRSRRGAPSSIRERDQEDERLRDALYPDNSSTRLVCELEFDTTKRSAGEIAEQIVIKLTGGTLDLP